MKDKIKGVLIDVNNGKVEVTEVENDYRAFQKVIDVDIFDIAARQIDDEVYDFVVDDEGLLKGKCYPSALYDDLSPALFGNCFICKNDGKGNSIGLTDAEIQHIFDNLFEIIYGDGKSATVVGNLKSYN